MVLKLKRNTHIGTVSAKGWVVLPKAIRVRNGLRKGDKVVIVDLGDGHIMIRPADDDPIETLRGIFTGGTGTKGLLEDRRWELEKEEEGLPPPRSRS